MGGLNTEKNEAQSSTWSSELWTKIITVTAILGLITSLLLQEEKDSSTIACSTDTKVTTIFRPQMNVPVEVPTTTTACERLATDGTTTQSWTDINHAIQISQMDTVYVIPRAEENTLSIVAFRNNKGQTATMHSE